MSSRAENTVMPALRNTTNVMGTTGDRSRVHKSMMTLRSAAKGPSPVAPAQPRARGATPAGPAQRAPVGPALRSSLTTRRRSLDARPSTQPDRFTVVPTSLTTRRRSLDAPRAPMAQARPKGENLSLRLRSSSSQDIRRRSLGGPAQRYPLRGIPTPSSSEKKKSTTLPPTPNVQKKVTVSDASRTSNPVLAQKLKTTTEVSVQVSLPLPSIEKLDRTYGQPDPVLVAQIEERRRLQEERNQEAQLQKARVAELLARVRAGKK